MENKLKNIKIGESYFVPCKDENQKETYRKTHLYELEVMINNPNLTLHSVIAEGGIIVFRVNSKHKQDLIELKKKQKRKSDKLQEADAVLKRKENRAIQKEADAFLEEEAKEEKRIKRKAKTDEKAEHQKGVLQRKKEREDRELDVIKQKERDREEQEKRDKDRQDMVDNYPGIKKLN